MMDQASGLVDYRGTHPYMQLKTRMLVQSLSYIALAILTPHAVAVPPSHVIMNCMVLFDATEI
jgi:hypothetical protein